MDRGLSGPHGLTGRGGEEKKYLPLLEIEPPSRAAHSSVTIPTELLRILYTHTRTHAQTHAVVRLELKSCFSDLYESDTTKHIRIM